MKALKTKVIMSAIVLVFAFIATIGSTYAWFTVSNIVEVTSFDINVESSEALLIKVWDGELYTGAAYNTYRTADDGGNDLWTLGDFSNSVDILDSDTYNGGANDIASSLLSPVTAFNGETAGGDTDYKTFLVDTLRKPTANFITDVDNSGRELAPAVANTSAGGFIELKFWLLKPAGNNTHINFSYTIDDGSLESYEHAIFIGTIDGVNQNVFGQNLDSTFAWSTPMPGTSSVSAYNSIQGVDAAAVLVAATGDANTSIATLANANIPELLTIRIWAEGWDADTVNAIMGAQFAITFQLTLVA